MMKNENLNIKIIQAMVNLENENKQYERIIFDFDNEINRLVNIIKEAYEYLNKKTILFFKEDKENLQKILSKGLKEEDDDIEIIS